MGRLGELEARNHTRPHSVNPPVCILVSQAHNHNVTLLALHALHSVHGNARKPDPRESR